MTTESQTDFHIAAKVALIRRGLTITELAYRIGYPRNTVSMAIHRPGFPKVKAKIKRSLGLE